MLADPDTGPPAPRHSTGARAGCRRGYWPVTSAEAAEEGLVPIAFVATTVNRYEPTAGSVISYDFREDASSGDDVCPRTAPALLYRVAVTT
jgi:hypothetical protein